MVNDDNSDTFCLIELEYAEFGDLSQLNKVLV